MIRRLRALRHLPVKTVLAGAGAAVLVVLLLGTLPDPQGRSLPAPSSTSSTQATTPTTEPDYSLVALPAIDGQTTTTAPMEKGRATLRGIVQGPDGPVPGAIISAERLVGDAIQRLQGRAGPDGTFAIEQVPGGRYRVRAFLPPSLVMGDPEVFYQPDGEVREMRLRLEPFTGVVVRDGTSPSAPMVGEGVNLAVRVSQAQVGDDGIAREVPVPGVQIRVSVSGLRLLDDRPVATTGSDGAAVFHFRCERVGAVTGTVTVAGVEETFPLDVPGCGPRATTTTTTVDEDEDEDEDEDDESTSSTTSTSTSTTSTTEG